MNAPLKTEDLKQDKLKSLLSDLESQVIIQGPGDITLGARNIYTDQALFELELEHMIEGSWVYALHESQIPKAHDYFTINVGRQPVVLTRDAEGKIHGFLNVCAHRGAKVVRHTKGNQKVHMCMFHGWCYNSKGELINVTDEEEGAYPPGFDRKDLGLTPVAKLESYRGFIWVSLNADVPPLKEYLNGSTTFIDLLADQSPTGELEVLPGETTYIYQGNWKLQAENGLDGYHLPTTHANYFMTVGQRAKGLSGNTTKTVDPKGIYNDSGFLAFKYGHGLIYFNYPNPQIRPGYEMREGHIARHGELRTQWMTGKTRNLLIMPNVFLMDQASTQIRVFRPLAVDRTEVTTYCIAPKGESAESREHRLRQYEDFFNASGMATPDDIAEFRNCQVGYQAKAAPWSEFSRGHSRWIKGTNEQGAALGVEAQMSSTHGSDEGLYVNILGEWAQFMQRIVKNELERARRKD